jgi:hypothetical protein
MKLKYYIYIKSPINFMFNIICYITYIIFYLICSFLYLLLMAVYFFILLLTIIIASIIGIFI